MDATLRVETTVAYADVDRRERMLLPRIFKLLQDGAIAQANQFGAGTDSVTTRGETWVLNRMAVGIARYPVAGERLRLETWSSGIDGFKGFRDFRVVDAQKQIVISASSLWLYVSARTKTITRVPADVVAGFPVGTGVPWCAGLERLPFTQPTQDAPSVEIALRFSDFDVNQHMNNAAYLDLVQTALSRVGVSEYPERVQVKYAKAIPLATPAVTVRLERGLAACRFGVEWQGASYAFGDLWLGSAGDDKLRNKG